MTRSPSRLDLLNVALDSRLSGLFTACPGRVQAFDKSTQRATVQPLVRQAYKDEAFERVVERLPAVDDVPIVFPGTLRGRLTFPVSVGDVVLLVFTSCSLERWLERGGEIDPQDDRRNTLSDAVAIPGLYSFNATLTPEVNSDAVVVHAEDELRLGSSDADQSVILGNDFLEALDTFLDDLAAFNVAVVPPTGNPAFTTAIAVFKGLLVTFLSSKVKVE